MSTFLVIVISIVTICFVVLSYYIVVSLIQIQKTAKKAEEVLNKISIQMENVDKVTSFVSSLTSSVSPALLSIASLLGGGIGVLLKKFFRVGGQNNERK